MGIGPFILYQPPSYWGGLVVSRIVPRESRHRWTRSVRRGRLLRSLGVPAAWECRDCGVRSDGSGTCPPSPPSGSIPCLEAAAQEVLDG